MGAGTILSLVWTVVSRGFSGGGLTDTAGRIIDRLGALKDAETEVEKAEIEREIVQLQAIKDLQTPSSKTWFSPMMVGQYLVVGSFGVWFASVCLVSVAKPLLIDGSWSVDDLPPHIFEMAWWLFPLIIIGTAIEKR